MHAVHWIANWMNFRLLRAKQFGLNDLWLRRREYPRPKCLLLDPFVYQTISLPSVTVPVYAICAGGVLAALFWILEFAIIGQRDRLEWEGCPRVEYVQLYRLRALININSSVVKVRLNFFFFTAARKQDRHSCLEKIYATHLFMPTELHSGHGGPSMVFYSHVEKLEDI